jgi:tetratricopeptide (TPR) repeat protein
MSLKINRETFAAARPIPPFGTVIAWVVEILQLEDPATYQSAPDKIDEAQRLANARQFLSCRTTFNVAHGEIVRDDTKREVSKSLACCIRNLRGLHFALLPEDQPQGWILAIWKSYEAAANILSALPEDGSSYSSALLRHGTIELALRAGAVACLCNDIRIEDQPFWSKHAELRKQIRKVCSSSGSRDELAKKLVVSPTELDRWLDELDTPGVGYIAKLEELTAAKLASVFSGLGTLPLWRLYVGRRVWESVRQEIPTPMREELLQAYSRIQKRVHAYHSLDPKRGSTDSNLRLMHLVITGRVTDPLLRMQLVGGEADLLWRKHIDAVCQVAGVATIDVLGICEMYSNAASAGQTFCQHLDAAALDNLVHHYLEKAANESSTWGRAVRLTDDAQAFENSNDYAHAAECIERLVTIWPKSAAHWNSLGRIRIKEGRPDDAERRYRRSLELAPQSFDARLDLAHLLVMLHRPSDAIEELKRCDASLIDRKEWLFAHGRTLLALGKAKEAVEEFNKCLKQEFKIGACYKLLAEAFQTLRRPNDALECRKRAAEFVRSESGPQSEGH